MMKNSVIVPLFAVTAVAAFGLGWVARPDGGSGRDGAGTGAQGLSSRVTSGSRRVGGEQSRSGGVASTREGEFIASYMVNGGISSSDMRQAIKEMSETNDPLLRSKMLALLLENLTSENAQEAFLALRDNRGGGRFGPRGGDEMRLLTNAWGRLDGAGAVAAIREMNEGEDGERGRGRRGRGAGGEMAGVLAGWATVDGDGAAAYLSEIEGDWESRMAAYGVVQGMLVNGVDGAMDFIQSLPESEDDRSKGRYMAMVTDEVLEQGLDQAKSWASTVTDPELRTGVLARVTMEIMEEDHQAAGRWIAQYGDEAAAASAVDRLAGSWAQEDPQAVLEWANQLSGDSKMVAYEEAINSWTREDPAAAGDFLGTLNASPERDAAVESYATRVSREDPASAMAWVNTIADSSRKQEAQVDVARNWYRSDQAAANTWIESSGLSEAAVQQITAPGRGGNRRGGGRGR